jgi:hypothetical protein
MMVRVTIKPRGVMQNVGNLASAEEIIQVVKQLPLPELEQLVDRVIAIRAERRAPHLTGNESELLSRINQSLSAGDRARLKELIDKRDAETITSTELPELIGMTDRLENLQAERLAALVELATLRGVTFDEVINQLGIQFPDHDD